ncbi:GNAT family N-acetyltransferase [Terasakiella sp.]|uniref:GNAT family N-acetyltransferase n=1 Tax=Terasakiella sp. TaxID=2034861 RepID=UPI003AA8DDDD
MSDQKDQFTVVTTPKDISPSEIAKVYNSVGFTIPETFYSQPDFKDRMFAPGAFGFFIFKGGELIGAARALSDDSICTWIPELCVMPDWQNKGIGSLLVQSIVERFSHTSIYAEAFKGKERVLEKFGIRPKNKLVSCSRAFTKNETQA